MSQELIYTSAPRGLKPGTRGFCTVVCTRQMGQPLAERLESLSGYRQLFAAHDAQATLNPVIHSHLILAIGGRKHHVLSRVSDAGLDYTQRSNKFAHHVALDATELPPGGPAWLLTQPGFMQTEWDGEPKLLPSGRRPPGGFDPPAVCRRWQELTGDAGWAGVLAETAIGPSPRAACLFFRPGQELLPLVAEALALLPLQQRWSVTFSTWFTKLPPGVDCQWRFLLVDSPEAKQARRQQHTLLIDLTAPLPNAGSSALVQAARTGVVTATAQPVAPPRVVAPAGQQVQEGALAAAHGRLPLASAAEYALGPPPVTGAPLPRLRTTPRKKRSKFRLVLVASMLAMLVLAAVASAVVAVHLADNNHGAKRPIAQADESNPPPRVNGTAKDRPKESEKSLPKGEGDRESATQPEGQQHADGKGERTDAPASDRSSSEEQAAGQLANATQPEAAVDKNGELPVPQSQTNAGGDAPADKKAPPNPFDELDRLGRRLKLPRDASKEEQLVTISPVDPNALELELIGWEQLQPGHNVTCLRRPIGSKVEWPITETVTNSGALPNEIGLFSFSNGSLRFKWNKKPVTALGNCLLRLRVRQSDADARPVIVALRKSRQIDSAKISFQDALSKVPLPLEDMPADINAELLRLEMALSETGKPASLLVFPPGEKVNSDRAVKVTIPLDQAGSVVVRANLVTNSSMQPTISLSYRWKHRVFDRWNGLVDEEVPLSIPDVERFKRGLANNGSADERNQRLKDRQKELDGAKQQLAALKEPKKKDDPDAEKRTELKKQIDDLDKEIAGLNQERLYFDTEPRRCDALLDLLNDLPKRLCLKVYFQLGKGSDETMRVMLAETAQE